MSQTCQKQTSTRDCDVRSVAQGCRCTRSHFTCACVAMSVAEYASYDAVGLAELVRKREVSPTELVEAAIERIEKHRMRQPFPKLRLCPRARPAVRRRGPP